MAQRKFIILFLIFIVQGLGLFASGKAEETEKTALKNDWVLCVTEFNMTAMPGDKKNIGSVITRKIVERLSVISYRTRISSEYAYYEEHAWNNTRSAAARNLERKQNERSLLVYRGDPAWKYKRDLVKIDDEIKKLKEILTDAEKDAPVINNDPVFKLTSGNIKFTYPPAPAPGGENKFCSDQKIDAFLTGSIMDFHGRYHVSLKLYALYTGSYIWEESIIFSSDDLDRAMEDITERMLNVLSGNKLVTITVKAEPKEALLLINSSFAGKGETPPLEHPPGKFVINASAAEHESLTLETELSGGETAEITMSLKPLEYANVHVPGTLSLGGTVYRGALYAGETPLTVRLPVNTLEYIELETPDGKKGSAVIQTPASSDSAFSLSIRTSSPLEKGRVDKARRMYYWAWSGTWLTGITAWITYHSYTSSDFAVRYNYDRTGSINQNFANNNIGLYYISMGTIVAVSAAVAYEIFQMIRYVYISDKGSTPVAKKADVK
ncbi:MAG: hypothetical protein LBH16_09690 [Treponema sp.]|jgi:hypothetical protein|nr:hypothetical protein [Treponema sp.]